MSVSENKKRFYTVVRGRVPGIYTSWFGPSGAEEQIRGYAGAIYRGFATMEEAQGLYGASTILPGTETKRIP